MKVHQAVWVFAETRGTKRTQKYTKERKQMDAVKRTKRDTEWLVGRGGTRLRQTWFDLPKSEKDDLMRFYPDPQFPVQADGVLDERTCRKPGPAPNKTATTTAQPELIVPDTQLAKQTQLHILERARSRYFDVKCQEETLRLHTAYNGGNLTGVIEALVEGVQSAILLAHSKDRCRTREETFAAVCERVSDVLAGAIAATYLPPDYTSDAPSAEFAQGRIQQAKRQYIDAVERTTTLLLAQGDATDPEPSTLHPKHRFFRKRMPNSPGCN